MAGSHHIMRLAAISENFDKSLDLTGMKIMLPMGTNVSTDVYDKLVKIFPKLTAVLNVYGMTEFGCKFTIDR